MFHIFFVQCADTTPFGRVGHATMDMQTLMEVLVSNLEGVTTFEDDNGCFTRIEQWTGLTFDEYGNVVSIDFATQSEAFLIGVAEYDRKAKLDAPGGNIDLRWIPQSVTVFSVAYLHLQGTVETCHLPAGMVALLIGKNIFTGTFDMDGLPQGIVNVSIEHNKFQGSLNMKAHLPFLRSFDADGNAFCGTLDLSSLPERLYTLRLAHNRFSGSIDLRAITTSLRCLLLSGNEISQDTLLVGDAALAMKCVLLDVEKFGQILQQDGRPVSENWGMQIHF
ncbi:leucine-rich repeat protein [Perkinsela sp. CCAP 1560/4]|nr:leucine-rich repeat protein [Perkinsela sp. CCAP 1560/4]|eukprot:KNH04947.1 leucine-rich repeat protein [Perkinsela sp. CCAP 1560/4]